MSGDPFTAAVGNLISALPITSVHERLCRYRLDDGCCFTEIAFGGLFVESWRAARHSFLDRRVPARGAGLPRKNLPESSIGYQLRQGGAESLLRGRRNQQTLATVTN